MKSLIFTSGPARQTRTFAMQTALVPDDENSRIAALHALGVLDTAPEPVFDALVRIASLVCGVPISLISLVDTDRQWFKANTGLSEAAETPRDIAFCSHAILDDKLFEVDDALKDARFADNPLVAGNPDIRFYAGAPVTLNDGSRVGTLCVIDRVPRQLNDTQREILRSLAVAAAQALQGRKGVLDAVRISAALQASEGAIRRMYEGTPALLYTLGPDGKILTVSDAWLAKFGYTRDEVVGRPSADFRSPESQVYLHNVVLPQLLETGRCDNVEIQMVTRGGEVLDMLLSAITLLDEEGRQKSRLSVLEDVTLRRRAERALADESQRLANTIDGTQAGTWELNLRTKELRLNELGARLLGYSLEELGPQTLDDRLSRTHPDDAGLGWAALEKHLAGETPYFETEARIRHRDGHWIWIYTRGCVMTRGPDGKPESMFGTNLDISERKQREEALRKSLFLLDRTGQLAGVGGWEVDLVNNTLYWSDQTCRIHGLDPGFRPSLERAINFYAPEARPVIQAAVENAIATGQGWDVELPLVRADGKSVWVRAVGSAEFEGGKPARLIGAFQDITERRRLASELAQQHELLRVTLTSIGDAVITTDASGYVTWLNPSAERMTGWCNEEAKGRLLAQVFHIVNEETRALAESPVTNCLALGKVVGLAQHTLLVSRNGVEFGVEDSAAPIRNAAGEVLGAVLVFHDVTEQRRLSGEMTYRATHDALTGLVNRAEFEVRLRRTLNKALDDKSVHALLYIDLDQFKLVNDACGHAVGDELLQQVSKLLLMAVRDRDTVARLGGDEFAVILEHCQAAQAQRVAEQICARMDDFRFVHDGRRFRIGTSIGLVTVDDHWPSPEAILQAADTSCYAAKEAGRNRVHACFDTDAAMRARHGEMQWTTRIEQALDENRFVLFAQRIESLSGDEDGIHAEVLLRMLDDDGSLIQPGAFLPAAERFHFASRIDRWVLQNSIAWMKELPSLGAVSNLSVNLSGQSVGDRAFHRWANDLLAQAGADICERLCLEITETAAVTNLADAGLFIEQVKAFGVRVALDDFGAGASSFGYLKSLKVDYLKIDGQFIRDVVVDPLDDAAVRCFVDVARVIGVKSVAEFVDNPAVLRRLQEIGVDFVQGYLLHRPAPIDDLLGGQSVTTVAGALQAVT